MHQTNKHFFKIRVRQLMLLVVITLAITVGLGKIFTRDSSATAEAALKEIPITIDYDGLTFAAETTRPIVEQALLELHLSYNGESIVTPALNEQIKPFETIRVKNKIPYSILADGTEINEADFATSIADLLQKNNITLNDSDLVEPGLATILKPATTIKITRILEQQVVSTEKIPFATTYENDADLSIAQQVVIQPGQMGIKEKTIERVYKNGVLDSENVVAEVITREPTDRIVKRGTKVITGDRQEGYASWYRSPFGSMTAASLKFEKGSALRVSNPTTGQSVIVTVQDTGPYDPKRVIDLSSDAFRSLGVSLGAGTTQVVVEELL